MPPTAPPLFIVDAFAAGPFTGNPAAVCLLTRQNSLTGWPDATWMQRLADEMNLSETAFVLPPDADRPDDPTYGLRWFTPQAEVELCGHATLAAAHVLFTEPQALDMPPPGATSNAVAFETRYAGVLTCTRAQSPGDPSAGIAMDFPAQRCEPAEPPPGLFAALRLDPGHVHAVAFGPYDFLLELDTPQRIADLEPDFAALAAFPCRGVAVTACVPHEHPQRDARFRGAQIVSRFFAPRLRIAEDPVTGSLHCVLATYWSPRLNTNTFTAYQASRRGGLIDVTLRSHRVTLAGQAFTVIRGHLAV